MRRPRKTRRVAGRALARKKLRLSPARPKTRVLSVSLQKSRAGSDVFEISAPGLGTYFEDSAREAGDRVKEVLPFLTESLRVGNLKR